MTSHSDESNLASSVHFDNANKMAGDAVFQQAVNKVLDLFSIEEMKPEQMEILQSLLKGRDCMAVMPTGYGKSLPYKMFPFVKRELSRFPLQDVVNFKILVCSPLVALMEDQVARLKQIPGTTAGYKGSDPETDEKIVNGEVDFIFASPESLLANIHWRDRIQQLEVQLIVIDEFHTIATWGGGEETDEAVVFRKWFRHVGELRSMFPSATILALSATCTKTVRKRVLQVLDLHPKSTTFVSVSPNKSNIKLVVKKVDSALESAMYWLVDCLETQRIFFPKCLIYANSISDVSKLYNYVAKELPDCLNYIDMFHSETTNDKKKEILYSLRDPVSETRIIFATSALGMGIDVMNCNSVLLYGPPRTTVDLIQEIGRVGRDGKQSVAVLLYNSYNMRSAERDLKSVYTTETCRRIELLSNFLKESELETLKDEINKHTCCDVCEKQCSCGDCSDLDIEGMLKRTETESSDSDTIDYEYNEYDMHCFNKSSETESETESYL